MKLLLADSGASKTDWALIQEGKPVYVRTSGMHPFYMDVRQIFEELHRALSSFRPDIVRFYGAGCVSDEISEPTRKLLKRLFGDISVEINSDLFAVAHAFLPQGDGGVAILGTGSSSGRFKGGHLVEQVPSLGYILGDEGSASDIAKHVLRRYLRGDFQSATVDYLHQVLPKTDYDQLVADINKSDRPSYSLGRIAEQFLGGPFTDEIHLVIRECLQSFVNTHLKAYEGYPDYRLVVAGGVANALKKELKEVLESNGFTQVTIQQSIISGLVERQLGEL